MPIHDAKPKKFNEKNVAKAPRKPGVYALYVKDELIFIGTASRPGVTIRGMLRKHMKGGKGPETAAATHYKREAGAKARIRLRELLREHVTKYRTLPRCNTVA
jgi:hypothetical protein